MLDQDDNAVLTRDMRSEHRSLAEGLDGLFRQANSFALATHARDANRGTKLILPTNDTIRTIVALLGLSASRRVTPDQGFFPS